MTWGCWWTVSKACATDSRVPFSRRRRDQRESPGSQSGGEAGRNRDRREPVTEIMVSADAIKSRYVRLRIAVDVDATRVQGDVERHDLPVTGAGSTSTRLEERADPDGQRGVPSTVAPAQVAK